MKRGRPTQGIAIISILLILAAVMMLGISSLYLTQMNLGIASNVGANTVAQNNANTGLSATFAALQERYEATGELPVTLGGVPSVAAVRGYAPAFHLSDDDYGYERLSVDTARISITGVGPRDAEHKSEALITIGSSIALPPSFDYGLASEGIVRVSGSADYTNTRIHGNRGFVLTGNHHVYTCVNRDEDGSCTRSEAIASASIPATASPGATTCKAARSLRDYDLCDEKGVPVGLVDPVEVEPKFAEKRDRALQEVSKGPHYSHVLGINCDVIYPSAPDRTTLLSHSSGETVCVEGGDVRAWGDWGIADVNLVIRDNFGFSGNWEASNVTLFSIQGDFDASGNSDVHDFRLFTEGDIGLSGNLSGETTLASGGDIALSGNADALMTDGEETTIGIGMVADGDIALRGSSHLFVGVIAGGAFSKSGRAELYGSIASKGDLEVSGNFDIDSGFPIDNDDLTDVTPAVLRTVSRR